MAHLAVAKARLLHEVYNKYWVLTQEQFAELRAREENTLVSLFYYNGESFLVRSLVMYSISLEANKCFRFTLF